MLSVKKMELSWPVCMRALARGCEWHVGSRACARVHVCGKQST